MSYVAFNQEVLHFWETHAQVRDSLANCYADDTDLNYQCVEIWTQEFGTRMMHIDTQVKQTKPPR